MKVNPLNAKLNPICHLLALLGANHILHVSRVRVNYKYFAGMKGTIYGNGPPVGTQVKKRWEPLADIDVMTGCCRSIVVVSGRHCACEGC